MSKFFYLWLFFCYTSPPFTNETCSLHLYVKCKDSENDTVETYDCESV